MLLTDPITEKHLEWLGDVEWKQRSKHYTLTRDAESHWNMQFRYYGEAGYVSWRLQDFIASCVLEHAIRVRLAKEFIGVCAYGSRPVWEIRTAALHYRFMNSVHETYEEALIAAMDALIGGEAQAPKTAE